MEVARGAGARISYDTNLRLKLWPLPRARAIIRATSIVEIVDGKWVLMGFQDLECRCHIDDTARVASIADHSTSSV